MDYEFGHSSTRQVLCFMWQQLVLLGGIQIVAGLVWRVQNSCTHIPSPLARVSSRLLSWALPSPERGPFSRAVWFLTLWLSEPTQKLPVLLKA